MYPKNHECQNESVKLEMYEDSNTGTFYEATVELCLATELLSTRQVLVYLRTRDKPTIGASS